MPCDGPTAADKAAYDELLGLRNARRLLRARRPGPVSETFNE